MLHYIYYIITGLHALQKEERRSRGRTGITSRAPDVINTCTQFLLGVRNNNLWFVFALRFVFLNFCIIYSVVCLGPFPALTFW